MPSESSNSIYLRCLQIMLFPIVRFCLRKSIKINEAIECIRIVMIQVAAEQINDSSEKISISKLSVITGMHRRDASRIFKKGTKIEKEPSVSSKVLGLWESSTKYLDAEGKPQVLSLEGENSDFFHLVRSINKHLNPYTVLYELERTSSVKRTAEGLKLIKAEFVPSENILESAKMLATDTEDLISGIEENISNIHTVPNLHLVTEYDNITPDAEQEIREWMLRWGGILHKRARTFLSKFDKDTNNQITNTEDGLRVVLGSFSRIKENTPDNKSLEISNV